MLWSGIGVNYGHQATYDPVQTEADYAYLQSIGITRLRIAMPTYTWAQGIANCQDMVVRALAHGFYVIWGVEIPLTETASDWASFKSYVTGTLAPWAQSVGLSELQLSNEVELHVDGTTLTAATVRADIRTMASTVKANGYTGKVSYSTAILTPYRTPWISEGIGVLDYIGWNSYDNLSYFATRVQAVQAAFGDATYISEFGSMGGGYPDFNDEGLFYTDTTSRIGIMRDAGIQTGYFFTYRDGGFGMPLDTFALVLSTGQVREAREAIKNVRVPVFSKF